jgi:hydroxyacylglutathione hydrolase
MKDQTKFKAMIKISNFIFNYFQENTYILSDETGDCVIVDPGFSSDKEKNELVNFIADNSLKPVAIINTHCHIDHILGCAYLQKAYNIPFYIHSQETDLMQNAQEYAKFYGLKIENIPQPDGFLKEGDTYNFGNSVLSVLHVPGHSPGSICLYSENNRFILTGDVLFRGSIGRSDLPGGDYNTLIKNIKSKILILPREVLVLSGHGPSTNIGLESDTNPFLK